MHASLMYFANDELGVIDEKVATPAEYLTLDPELRAEVHEAFVEHPELIDAFADENPFDFDDSELEIVRSWKHFVTGTFYVFRYLRDYAVFLTESDPVVAYGVVALFDPFEALVGPHLPRLVTTTLLPFKGRIVYDGLLVGYNVTFGGGVKRRLNEEYQEAKAERGILTSLPDSDAPATLPMIPKKAKAAAAPRRNAKGGAPSKASEAHDRIVALTDAFCRKHLDEQYAELCRKLAGVLARKRSSPITSGKPESWASGIVRAVGFVNFLGDPSKPHHMKMTDVDKGFGVSEATGSAKSMAIRRLLDIHRFDPDWTLPSMMGRNPLVWMLELDNGLIIDVRGLPKSDQEEAFRAGLIPYVPGDDDADEE